MRNKSMAAQKPHYGVTHGLRRKGRSVIPKSGEVANFPSIRSAKYFMRTGEGKDGKRSSRTA